MKRRVLILTAAAAASLLAGPALARRHGPPPGMGDGAVRALGAMLHVGDLSDEQRAQMRARLESGRAAAEPSMEALREANDELSALLLGAEAPTGEALSAAIDRVTVLRTQLLADAAEAALDLRAILTADQLATAATLPEPHDRHMPLP